MDVLVIPLAIVAFGDGQAAQAPDDDPVDYELGRHELQLVEAEHYDPLEEERRWLAHR